MPLRGYALFLNAESFSFFQRNHSENSEEKKVWFHSQTPYTGRIIDGWNIEETPGGVRAPKESPPPMPRVTQIGFLARLSMPGTVEDGRSIECSDDMP